MGSTSRSAAVITSTTPGASRASDTSTDSRRACGMVERTTVIQTAPGSGRSSTYFPPVVRNAGSSRRSTRFPRMLTRRTLQLCVLVDDFRSERPEIVHQNGWGTGGGPACVESDMRRLLAASAVALLLTALAAAPAVACGGLVAPNGTVRLLRTSTLAAYHDGIEHYVTSFTFTGGGAEVGSIVPLPGVPTKVERGGDWTLQRLQRETQPPVFAADAATAGGVRAESAKVLLETRIDALDL